MASRPIPAGDELAASRELVPEPWPRAAPVTLEVRVLENRAEGRGPVAGVDVEARLFLNSADPSSLLEHVQSKTNADGIALLAFPFGGAALVGAAAPGRCASAWVALAGGEHELQLVLTRALMLHGRVADAVTGRPIGAARVSCADYPWEPASTDGQGRFTFGPWRLGSSSSLRVRAEGYASEGVELLVRLDGSWALPDFGSTSSKGTGSREPYLELSLAVERVVTGRVVDLEGNPVAALRVIANVPFADDSITTVCRTDSRGRFRLEGLRPDFANAVWVWVGDSFTGVRDRSSCDVGDLRIETGSTLHGSIHDARGRPVADGLVVLAQVARTDRTACTALEMTRTDADGRFALHTDANGEVRVCARGEGGQWTSEFAELRGPATELGVLVLDELRDEPGRESGAQVSPREQAAQPVPAPRENASRSGP